MWRLTLVPAALAVVLGSGCGDSSSPGEDAADRVWMRLGAQTASDQLCIDLVQPGDERDRIVTQLYSYDEISSLSDDAADAAVSKIVELCDGLVNAP